MWACKNYSYVYFFTNNNAKNGFKTKLFASDSLLNLQHIDDLNQTFNKYHCGWISYDIKNQIEELNSNNQDLFKWNKLGFIKAETLIEFNETKLKISSTRNPKEVYKAIKSTKDRYSPPLKKINFTSSKTREDYIKNVNSLRTHIEEGDIYEACYCLELLSENTSLTSPVNSFFKLCKNSPKPFATFVKAKSNYLLGASPERFIKKENSNITSQPIKGTIKRGKNLEEDEILKKKLFLDPKERAENLMIVDLVRNDLARISESGSVKVDELFGIYSFPNVHQMISTIRAQLKNGVNFSEIIKATFPMGSMTGAPKIKAMELIEKHENFSRGLYSGTVGYFEENSFDFNVTIRSLQYNDEKNLLGLHVGSAITYDSIPEKEYEECMIKALSVEKIIKD